MRQPHILPAGMARARHKTGSLVLLAVIVVYAVVVLGVGAYRARLDQSSTSDFDDFWLTAHHFVETGEIVEDYGVHNYPPFFVLSLIPLSLLPLKVASVAFNLGSLLGFVLCVRLVDRWMLRDSEGAAGRDSQRDVHPPSGFLRIAAPIGMVLPYLTGCLVLGQMAIWTLLMLVLAWEAVERGRHGRSGFWLALAISTKVYPAVFLLYFALKRQWRLGGHALVWLGIFNLALPILALGVKETSRQYALFWRETVQGHSSLNLAVVNSDKMSYTNQSTAILVHRLTQPTESGVDSANGTPRFMNLVDWRDRLAGLGGIRLAWAQWLWLSFAAGIVGLTAWVCRHPAARLSPLRRRIEYAAFVPLSLLLSPIVWSFYYAVVYLPLALIAWLGLMKWRRNRRWSPEFCVTLLWWGGVAAVAIPLARMWGYHAMASMALLAVCLWRASGCGLQKEAGTPEAGRKKRIPPRAAEGSCSLPS